MTYLREEELHKKKRDRKLAAARPARAHMGRQQEPKPKHGPSTQKDDGAAIKA